MDSQTAADIERIAGLSDFIDATRHRYPELVSELADSGRLVEPGSEGQYATLTRSLPNDEAFDRALRLLRKREMFRIIFRDFSHRADLWETTRDLSNLADACLQSALDHYYGQNCEKYGTPRLSTGEPMTLFVIALGKLGACELNLSSDIDLVFGYHEPGVIEDSGKSHQEFFMRLARQLIASLDETTSEGIVFRVDMRLRPYGESGPLVMHRPALEKYFVEEGRDWERYAFIKARTAAGAQESGDAFLDWLRPFVYRKHLDYGAIEALREMKRLIDRQVELKELQDDLKLGPGGIREVEFIAQMHQLIFGGHEVALQVPRLREVLQELVNQNLMPADEVAALMDAYVFLRNSEHAIQGEGDKQTQLLPPDSERQKRLAEVMGFEAYESYILVLNQHRENVRQSFAELLQTGPSEQEQLLEGNLHWISAWNDPASATDMFARCGFEDASSVVKTLVALKEDVAELQEVARERMSRLMPVVLSLVARQAEPTGAISRVMPIIDSILRRSTYLAFLLENVDALQRLVTLCAMSPWVSEQLEEHPILLYELSDRNHSSDTITRDALATQLSDLLMVLDPGDLESQMDALRQFKHGAVMRTAILELLGELPLMRASDALTNIAELVLSRSLELAWDQLVNKHGLPCDREGNPQPRAFAIVAYGKLGGIELAYGSDLDLVFLYEADIHGETNGTRAVNNNVFYSRLVQRMVHLLTTLTRFGVLYELDLRLRPAGSKGAVASTFSAYERYLLNDAWTWEHQSLVRARLVAGDNVEDRFQAIRSKVLAQPRDADQLRKDVTGMREKMRAHLAKGSTPKEESLATGFDLKHDTGAIVDIEFMVQYAVLSRAHAMPNLIRWTDKMRLLDELADSRVLDAADAKKLQAAYLAYRAVVHYEWLGGRVAASIDLLEHREVVMSIWKKFMEQEV